MRGYEKEQLEQMNAEPLPPPARLCGAHWEIWFQYLASCEGRK